MLLGFWGLLQPLADGAKLMFKELLIPTRANAIIFLTAPIMVLILSIISWSIVPFGLVVESHVNFLSQMINPLMRTKSALLVWINLQLQILVMVFYFY